MGARLKDDEMNFEKLTDLKFNKNKFSLKLDGLKYTGFIKKSKSNHKDDAAVFTNINKKDGTYLNNLYGNYIIEKYNEKK